MPVKEVNETEDHLIERIKEAGLMNYKPTGSVVFDWYRVYEHLEKRSILTCTRLVIEM